MANRLARPLHNFELVEHFLENGLSIDLEKEGEYDIVSKIVATELSIANFDHSLVSLNSKLYRFNKYRNDLSRKKLHKCIVNELMTEERLLNDDEIELGKGGAFPSAGVSTQRIAYILTGLPASGKSGIASIVADHFGAFILDSDYAKRKLPEFRALSFGAGLVHDESDRIIFGEPDGDFKSLFTHCVSCGANIVLPKIGDDKARLEKLIKALKNNNYEVHLTLIELDRSLATKYALLRFCETGRYVPLSLIFDAYSNNPTVTFYKCLTDSTSKLKSYGIISTNVNLGCPPERILTSGLGNPANLF